MLQYFKIIKYYFAWDNLVVLKYADVEACSVENTFLLCEIYVRLCSIFVRFIYM